MPGTDRHSAGSHGWTSGRDRGGVEHLMDEVEPGAAHEERCSGEARPLAGHQGQAGQADGQQTGTAHRDNRRRSTPHKPSGDHAERQRADENRALDRTVPPHLDDQQHAEEQGGDEGREHQGEAGVGDDDVAPARAGPAVQLALPPQDPSGFVGRDDKRGGDDRCLDDKDRPPVEQLSQHTAESRADRNADGAGHRPPPPRPPLVTDNRTEYRQRPGQHERGPDALDGAGGEEEPQARGHAGSQRSGSEHGDTAHDKH